jgi:hypothetical protein
LAHQSGKGEGVAPDERASKWGDFKTGKCVKIVRGGQTINSKVEDVDSTSL